MKNAFVKLKYKFGVVIKKEMPINDVCLFLVVLPGGIIGNMCVKIIINLDQLFRRRCCL